MQTLSWIVAGIFLPLFPLGMVFNTLLQKTRNTWLRALLLLVWPLPGVAILHVTSTAVSSGFVLWALFSAALYGFRAVVVREFGVWTGFLATSAWVLSWVALAVGVTPAVLVLQVLAFSLPLALLNFLTTELERRYESAYAGIVSGIAQAQPRLSGMLVLAVLAVIGSPLFPAFFSMLNNITRAITELPLIAAGVAGVWLLWSWSGVRLLQELLVGPVPGVRHVDISQGVAASYGLALLVLTISGLYFSGVML